MKRTSSLFIGLLALGALLVSAPRAVHAATDGENAILNLLNRFFGDFTTVSVTINEIRTQQFTRLDAIDSKLERIYDSCGRTTTTATRRVTTAQINSCINACFTSSATGASEFGAVGTRTFVACVSRCPSNTLRNLECAQRYSDKTATTVLVNGDYLPAAQTVAGMTRSCSQRLPTQAALCGVYANALSSNLTACLFDNRAFTCQSDCDRNYRNDAGYLFCMLRCENATRATETFNRMQNSGFINEDGRLSVNTLTNTNLQLPPPAPVVTPAPTTVVAPVVAPTTETYAQCVYRCGDNRTSCLALPTAQSQACESEYSGCYLGCSARLSGGVGVTP
ncbi:hypothetical protein KBD34_02980 [Patescibacteria group bacterium]|nr:hypothetical protein [Patescibacteria group bacterium]